MKIEKINENQIRCTLSSSDLSERQLNLGELAYGSAKAKGLFQEMMEQAFTDFGFEVEDNPLMVEAIPLSGNSIMLVITKVDDPEELDTRFSRFTPTGGEDFSMEDTLQQLLEGADLPHGPEPAAAEKPDQPETARIYQFPTLDAVTQAAQVLDSSFDGHNSLYRDPAAKDYYLVISRQGYEENAFARVLNTIQEFGSRVKSSYATESYFEEHFELIIDGLAIQVLSAL